jgi:protein TonB
MNSTEGEHPPSAVSARSDIVPGATEDRRAMEAPSEDGLRQYRLALAREARRFKGYPAYARGRGWQGDVVILLNASPAMESPVISLENSSGYPLLDDQALEIVRRAAGQAGLPDTLRGKRFRIAIPIQFRLDE